MKLKNSTKVFATTALLFAGHASAQSNLVLPSDTNLVVKEYYNNPMRIMWNAGAAVGADVSRYGGGVMAEFIGNFSPKYLNFRINYGRDISNGALFSKSPLLSEMAPYSSIGLLGVFNFKDEITSEKANIPVGANFINSTISGNTKTTTFNAFHAEKNLKMRNTKGFGVSINRLTTFMQFDSAKAEASESPVTLKNNVVLPANFLLAYNATFFGIGYHQSRTKSYKYISRYNYEGKLLDKVKVKYNGYNYTGLELLFAPGIGTASQIVTQNGGLIQRFDVDNVKKRIWGFRAIAFTNTTLKKMGNKKPGLFINGEAGMRPGLFYAPKSDGGSKLVNGIIGQPWYMKFSLGLGF
ncbi:MAG: hypothetical protein IT244_09900 [Bacteroidia bacterium]|nr:hypothetical protein [Bacteroidia bacterium]